MSPLAVVQIVATLGAALFAGAAAWLSTTLSLAATAAYLLLLGRA